MIIKVSINLSSILVILTFITAAPNTTIHPQPPSGGVSEIFCPGVFCAILFDI